MVVSVINTEQTQALVDRFTISRNTFNSDEMVTETIIGEFGNMLEVSILLRCTDSFTGANCEQAVGEYSIVCACTEQMCIVQLRKYN